MPYVGAVLMLGEWVKPGTVNSADGSSSIRNVAEAGSGGDHASKDVTTTVTHAMLQKSLGYKTSDKYLWTITVNPDHQDITGYTLKDILTVDGKQISLPSKVTVMKQNSWPPKTVSFSADGTLEFPLAGFDATDTYIITYETDIPTGEEGTSYTSDNKATFTKGSKIYTAEATAEYKVPVKQYGVQKWSITDDNGNPTRVGSAETKEGYNLLTWVARIDLPSSVTNASDMTFTDTVKDSDGKEDGSAHYTTAKLLNDTENTYLWTEDGHRLTPETDYRIFSGDIDITESNSEDPITNFRIVFTNDYVKNRLKGQTNISLNYQTMAVTEGMHVGNSRTFLNTASVKNQTSDGKYVYKVTGDLDKQSSASKDGPYSSGNVKVDLSTGKIYYRLLLKINKSNSQNITVTDMVPDGLTIDEDSISAKYAGDENVSSNVTDRDTWNNTPEHPAGYLGDNSVMQATVSKDRKTLKVSLFSGKYANEFPYLVVFYSASIDTSENSVWNDKTVTKKIYSNKASWEEKGISDTQDTEVDRGVKNVEKSVQQITDSSGKLTKYLEYQVAINPLALDLVPDSDTIKVTDKITEISNGAVLRFLPDTVTLYEYSDTAENHRGEEINRNRYSYTYDDSTHELKFSLPDETACVAVYRYYVMPGVNMPTIGNSASIDGVSNAEDSVKETLKESSSSSSATQSVLYLYKVDADNFNKMLPNVPFTLQVYDKQQAQKDGLTSDAGWSNVKTFTTGDGSSGSILGGIKFVEGDEGHPEKGKLYRLIEGQNLNSGYGTQKEPVKYYFVWMNRSGTNNNSGTIWNDIGGYYELKNTNPELSMDTVHWVYDEGSMYITNPYKAVSVQKVWVDENNKDIDNPGRTAVVHLYRASGSYNSCKVTVNVSDKENRTGTYQVDVEPGTAVSMKIYYSGGSMSYDGNSLTSTWDQSAGLSYFPINLGTVSSDQTISVTADYEPNMKTVVFDYTKPTTFVRKETKLLDTRTLSSSNNWQYIWDGTTKDAAGNTVEIPDSDGNGNTYYYYVTEDPVSGFTTTYSENNTTGIQTGVITVTNKKDKTNGYVLPSTGGVGTVPFYVIGAILAIFAIVALVVRAKMKDR